MSLDWRDPPDRVNAVFTRDVIAELRANPGEWALIRTYHRTSNSKVTRLKHPMDIELLPRYIAGNIELYARAKL